MLIPSCSILLADGKSFIETDQLLQKAYETCPHAFTEKAVPSDEYTSAEPDELNFFCDHTPSGLPAVHVFILHKFDGDFLAYPCLLLL